MQRHLKGGDDRKAPAAAAQRPEEVGLALGIDAQRVAGGGDDLEGHDLVGRQPVQAAQPADATTEAQAGHVTVCYSFLPQLRACRGAASPEFSALSSGQSRGNSLPALSPLRAVENICLLNLLA